MDGAGQSLGHDKRILLTGACGTVGAELLAQILDKNPASVIGIDNNESELFFKMEAYRSDPRVHLYLGDMRDRNKLASAMRSVDIVIHSAALKHVMLCEQSPRDAVQTNVLGVQNVIDAALALNNARLVL